MRANRKRASMGTYVVPPFLKSLHSFASRRFRKPGAPPLGVPVDVEGVLGPGAGAERGTERAGAGWGCLQGQKYNFFLRGVKAVVYYLCVCLSLSLLFSVLINISKVSSPVRLFFSIKAHSHAYAKVRRNHALWVLSVCPLPARLSKNSSLFALSFSLSLAHSPRHDRWVDSDSPLARNPDCSSSSEP